MGEHDDHDDGQLVRVLIVDDHEVVALGLAALLDEEPRLSVVGTAHTVADALSSVQKERPDVVFMDYRLPDGTGVEATGQIVAGDGAPGVVMVTAVADRRVFGQALEAGCCGFVSKNADRRDLVEAALCGARHESYFTRDVLKHLVHLQRFDYVEGGELSEREIEVLQASADGRSPDEIAAEMFLSAHTVKNHIRHAMEKLHAHTKLEAVITAIRLRIVSIDD